MIEIEGLEYTVRDRGGGEFMQMDQVKKAMRNKTLVSYNCSYINGDKFYIIGCIMRLLNSEWYYQLELADMTAKTNSVIIADMDKVEIRE